MTEQRENTDMLKPITLVLPIVALFVAVGLLVLSARAPRTWASHWASPHVVGVGASALEFGAVPRAPGDWDVLSVDDDRARLIYTSGLRPSTQTVLDRGEVLQPALARWGTGEVGAWVHNRNGGTDLNVAYIDRGRTRVIRLLSGTAPIEHPYLFGARGNTIDLVVSWQAHGNFDLYLIKLRWGATRPLMVRRLTYARYYSFYPRAVLDRHGTIHLLHLEVCCKQQVWNVVYSRYDSQGRLLGRPRTLFPITGLAQFDASPGQWPEDISLDRAGNVWGAFSGGTGVYVFKADPEGRILHRPTLIDTEETLPTSTALTFLPSEGYLFWDQSFDLGTYIDSRRFDLSGRPRGSDERLAYEPATETDAHATVVGGHPQVIWQSVSRDLRSHFETVVYRARVRPTLAQRLGLGLGDPWGEAAILVVGAVGVALLTTMGNILTVFGLALVDLLVMRLLRRVPGRWVLGGVLLSAALFAVFVTPGGPILFMGTLPSLGLATAPFGLVATAGALGLVTWTGAVALRRVEDLYRAGVMAVAGVYFFAFVEAIVFIQQRIGYI